MDFNTAPTPVADIPRIVNAVASKAKEWSALPAAQKLKFLEGILSRCEKYGEMWRDAAYQSHHVVPSNPKHLAFAASVAIKGAPIMANYTFNYKFLYEALVATGKPPAPLKVTDNHGKKAVQVFPWGVRESVLAAGGVGEVYLQAGKDVEQFNPLEQEPGVVAVLGAGNFSAPVDVLYSMFIENKVCVYKANPVNAAETPYAAMVMEELIASGYLAVTYGGVAEGTALLDAAEVSYALMTGAARTHDLIKFGTTDPAKKTAESMKFRKRLCAELGSVNPLFVVPGRQWTDDELAKHAQGIVAAKLANNGHICASPQVLITCKKWPQREAFFAKLREYFAKSHGTAPYYPNSDKMHKQHYDILKAECKDYDPMIKNQECFANQQFPVFATDQLPGCFATQNEAFAPILIEVPVDCEPTFDAYVAAAVPVANQCWGTLTCWVLIDDETKNANMDAFNNFVANLQFGSVGINQWPGMNFIHGSLTWGGFPGHSAEDIQSGVGVIGNSFCLRNVEKSVQTMPFKNPSLPKVGVPGAAVAKQNERVANFLITRSPGSLAMLIFNAVTGK